MGEIKGSRLRHIIKVSWESEQMPGWEDSLSIILEETKKEFRMKEKDVTTKNMGNQSFEGAESILEEGITK